MRIIYYYFINKKQNFMIRPGAFQFIVHFKQELSRQDVITILDEALKVYNSSLSEEFKKKNFFVRLFFPLKRFYRLIVTPYTLDSRFYFPSREIIDPLSGETKSVRERIYSIYISNHSNRGERYDVLYGSLKHNQTGRLITDFKSTNVITIRTAEGVSKRLSFKFLSKFSESLNSVLMGKQLLSIS